MGRGSVYKIRDNDNLFDTWFKDEGLSPFDFGDRAPAVIRGRSGDLLVVRIACSETLNERKKASLRSLNLATVGSAALCHITLPNTHEMLHDVSTHVIACKMQNWVY